MSLWIPSTAIEPDEYVVFEALANNFAGGWRAIGGRVTVTNRRLLFTPNRVDGMTGGRRLAIERRDIKRVSEEEPGRQAARQHGLGALMRRYVGVEHPAGPTFFVAGHPERLLSALQDEAA